MEKFPQFGQVTWRSPSNIALTKYWGKYGQQLPRNSSLSFTLNNACTETELIFSRTAEDQVVSLDFEFEGKSNVAFKNRIQQFIEDNIAGFSHLQGLHLSISSKNSFPHSSGIASSASSMSALVLCLCSVPNLKEEEDEGDFLRRVSHLSRLASGSACRSVFSEAALWGKVSSIPEGHLEHATGVGHLLHENFKSYHDDILIVSANEKSISSSAGHQLMETNRYASERFAQANERTERMIDIIKAGNLDDFIEVVESEALTLHALMMTSSPSYILMEPNTLDIISKIREFRASTQTPICFTLDAGPNVHVLYPTAYAQQCDTFIEDQLKHLCVRGRIIRDHMGKGPECLDKKIEG